MLLLILLMVSEEDFLILTVTVCFQKNEYNFKIILLKMPWNSLKKAKFGPESKLFKLHIWSLSFNFLAESLKANKNRQKGSLIVQYRFAQNTSLILQASTHSAL